MQVENAGRQRRKIVGADVENFSPQELRPFAVGDFFKLKEHVFPMPPERRHRVRAVLLAHVQPFRLEQPPGKISEDFQQRFPLHPERAANPGNG